MEIRDVWGTNLEEELDALKFYSVNFPYFTVDTEFTGFIAHTDREASTSERYKDLKHNVDNLKIVQLGVTLSDQDGVHAPYSWQFNFRDYDPVTDRTGYGVLRLRLNNGIDLMKNRREGIDSAQFQQAVHARFLFASNHHLKLITFHGLYDIGYLLKLLIGRPMPETLAGFMELVRSYFHEICDLKRIARAVPDVDPDRLSLKKLGQIMGVERIGVAHQAASDSLLTSQAFWKTCSVLKDMGFCLRYTFDGILYGLEPENMKRLAQLWGRGCYRPFHPHASPSLYYVYTPVPSPLLYL